MVQAPDTGKVLMKVMEEGIEDCIPSDSIVVYASNKIGTSVHARLVKLDSFLEKPAQSNKPVVFVVGLKTKGQPCSHLS